jgi:hypothetical protein
LPLPKGAGVLWCGWDLFLGCPRPLNNTPTSAGSPEERWDPAPRSRNALTCSYGHPSTAQQAWGSVLRHCHPGHSAGAHATSGYRCSLRPMATPVLPVDAPDP